MGNHPKSSRSSHWFCALCDKKNDECNPVDQCKSAVGCHRYLDQSQVKAVIMKIQLIILLC